MHISELLSAEHIVCNSQAGSKKRVLEQAAGLLTAGQTELTSFEVFDSLLARERLGSTGLGHGVALPHCRVAGTERTRTAMIKLEQGVDFDAADGQRVDLVFALMVPQESTEEHLQLLAQLAEMFSDEKLVSRLRSAESPADVLDQLKHWHRPAA